MSERHRRHWAVSTAVSNHVGQGGRFALATITPYPVLSAKQAGLWGLQGGNPLRHDCLEAGLPRVGGRRLSDSEPNSHLPGLILLPRSGLAARPPSRRETSC